MAKKIKQDKMVEQMLNAGFVKHPEYDTYIAFGIACLTDKDKTFTLTNMSGKADWVFAEGVEY